MNKLGAKIQEPAAATAQWLGLQLLARARRASAKLSREGGQEALHEFRVAVRKLRVCQRAYADLYDDRVSGKLRKRLGKLMEQTNAVRDRHVQVQWLENRLRRKRRPALLQTGIRLMLDELEGKGAADKEVSGKELAREFARLDEKVANRLQRPKRLGKASIDHGPSFAVATAELLGATARALQTELRRLQSPDDQEHVHRTRLLAKQMRYVLEPVTDAVVGGGAAVRSLKQLQDWLGAMHDLHVLDEEILEVLEHSAQEWAHELFDETARQPRPRHTVQRTPRLVACQALAAVGRLTYMEREAVFGRLRDWMSKSGPEFFALLAAGAEVLPAASRTNSTGPAST